MTDREGLAEIFEVLELNTFKWIDAKEIVVAQLNRFALLLIE